MTDAIVLEGITKTFGTKVAVRDLDLVVPRGSLYGFIGPNGAGKTTTIRMIMSILFPDSGRVEVLGHASALEAKDRIGYLPEERGVYRKMKVGSFLRYMGHLKGAARGTDVSRWLERVGLSDVEGKRCEELSKGMLQKIQFIASVIHEPDLLILDEPFSGLDPVNMRLLRELFLEQHERGATIIFSTHVMHQAEQLCDHIVMIHDGDKVLDDTLPAIRARHDPRLIFLEPVAGESEVEGRLGALAGVEGVSRADGRYEVLLEEGSDPQTLLREIVGAVPPARIELHRPTLEDVFVGIVTASQQEGQAPHDLRAALRAGAVTTEEEA
ncbi:MAG: ATP-binding cassette domain-containing protein [bacterium]|nr:ATP-binding cassette domain-containing protein [bacterium]